MSPAGGGARSRYCVVIPAFQARATIGPLVKGVRARQLDLIVVDDGSRDETARLALANGATVINHLCNQGKGAALRTGFQHALRPRYDGVITMDSDGQHDPADLCRLIEAGERGSAHIVVGNRMDDDRRMPLARRWTNRLMSSVVSCLVRQPVPDSQCGFRFIRREVLAAIPLTTTRFDIETELLLAATRCGWRLAFVQIPAIYNRHPSHIRPFRDGLRFLWLVVCHLLTPNRRAR